MPAGRGDAVERLCAIYREVPQVVLVLGAGVSKDSGVPLYRENRTLDAVVTVCAALP